jgi:ADP-ribosylglycohydrolase
MELPLRLSGAVWGHLVGDAVGVPYEFRPPASIGAVRFGASGTHRQPPGTWSDDGALTLALLDSLLAVGFDPDDQGRRFLAWRDWGAYTPDGDGCFDIGNATSEALRRLRGGVPAGEAGPSGEYDNGNGSLMRILPLALVGHTLPEAELIEQAHRSSRVTHGHAVAQAACALYVLLARELLLADESGVERGGALERARETLRAYCLGSPGLEQHCRALDTIEAYPRRTGSGYVVDAFWSAWDALKDSASYHETIERSVRYGNDTDTTACIAGGLAGAWFGLDGIPADWLAGMRGRAIVDPLVDRLIAHAGWRTSGANPLRVDWVDPAAVPPGAGWRGRLGMTLLPGKKFSGYTGEHWRDLSADATRLHELGADALLLLVEDHELRECRVPNIVAVMADSGIEVVRHPVADLEAPADRDEYRATLGHITARLRDGRSVAVVCRGGLGRTGTAVACLLVDAGLAPDDAIALTRRTLHGTIERGSQETFVRAWPST